MQLSQKVMEKNHEEQQKKNKERAEYLKTISDKIYALLEDENVSVKDASIILRAIGQSFENSFQAILKPNMEELNGKSVKAFFEDATAKKAT